MAKRKKEPCQNHRVGDRVRFVQLPKFQGIRGSGLHPETLQLYKRLISRGRPSRVYIVDLDGLPRIRCQFRQRNGKWELVSLAGN